MLLKKKIINHYFLRIFSTTCLIILLQLPHLYIYLTENPSIYTFFFFFVSNLPKETINKLIQMVNIMKFIVPGKSRKVLRPICCSRCFVAALRTYAVFRSFASMCLLGVCGACNPVFLFVSNNYTTLPQHTHAHTTLANLILHTSIRKRRVLLLYGVWVCSSLVINLTAATTAYFCDLCDPK